MPYNSLTQHGEIEMLNPQPCDMIGENCERLPVGEVSELQIMLCEPLTGEEFCEFLNDEIGEFPGLCIVDGEEFYMRFCS
jgi:hypothetical protein